LARQAELRLDRLEAATNLSDLAALPGNRLEALKGDRRGQYSIRINEQWRICFEWPNGSPGPINVEIVDYH
jgi:proteic killer suppression protein